MEEMILRYKKELIEIQKQLGWNDSRDYRIQLLERLSCIRDFIASLERALAEPATDAGG